MTEAPPSNKLKRLSLVARHSPTTSSFGEGQTTPTKSRRPMSMYGSNAMYGDLVSSSSSSSLGSGRGESLDLTSPRSRLSYVSSGPSAASASAPSYPHSQPPTQVNGTTTSGTTLANGTAASEGKYGGIGLGIDTTTATVAAHRANNSLSSDSSRSSDSMPTPPNGPSPLEQITPRLNRHQNKRSSISYSPSNTFSPSGHARSSLERLERNSLDRTDRQSSLGILLEGEPAQGTPNGSAPLTLAERHAELLHAIAASERRVAELRSALTAEEKSLSALRRQFSTAVAAEHTQHTPTRRKASISEPLAPLRALSPSSNSTPSSRPLTGPSVSRTSGDTNRSPTEGKGKTEDGPLATLKESLGSSNPAADTIGVGALWSAMAQDAEETIQEGKRFWDQLMKSVSSASPSPAKSPRPESHIGLSGIKSMLPSLPSLLPEPQPQSRPKDVRLKRASLTPVSPSPNPKLPLSGSSGSEIGLSRTASRNSAVSSASTSSQNLAAQGMSRSASQTSTSSASLSVESAQQGEGKGERRDEGEKRRSEPPTPSSLAAVLGNVMW